MHPPLKLFSFIHLDKQRNIMTRTFRYILPFVLVLSASLSIALPTYDNGLDVDDTTLLDASRYDDGSDHTRSALNLENALSGRYGKNHQFLKIDGGNLIGGYHSEGYTGNDINSYLALGGEREE